MVLGSTIIAVALGLTPAQDGVSSIRLDQAAYTHEVGRYREKTDRNGLRTLSGFDRSGRPYRATVDANGHVECYIEGQVIEFTVAEGN